jgi:hypothetical protein
LLVFGENERCDYRSHENRENTVQAGQALTTVHLLDSFLALV